MPQGDPAGYLPRVKRQRRKSGSAAMADKLRSGLGKGAQKSHRRLKPMPNDGTPANDLAARYRSRKARRSA